MASRREIRAVRGVLYDRKRLQDLHTQTTSINVLMNLDPSVPLNPGDVRIQPGAGPNWVIPATGQVDPAVVEAADRCRAIATTLLDMRRELQRLSLDPTDRRHLAAGLAEQAEAWHARADAWSEPGQPADVDAAVASITVHEQASLRHFKKVTRYLAQIDPQTLG